MSPRQKALGIFGENIRRLIYPRIREEEIVLNAVSLTLWELNDLHALPQTNLLVICTKYYALIKGNSTP